MKNELELWIDSRFRSSNEIVGSMVRREVEKAKITKLDLSYLSAYIEDWWRLPEAKDESYPGLQKNYLLKKIIIENLDPAHLETIKTLGLNDVGHVGVLLENVFSIPDKNLASLIHKIFTEILGLTDIKYPYEKHSELYPILDKPNTADWGKGLGIIRPHSDDLYEPRDINTMALTVVKDTSATPTWLWLQSDVLSCLTDHELGLLATSEAIFRSGANVEGQTLESKKPVLRIDKDEGVSLRLDFRIDPIIGHRMQFENEILNSIMEKMRQHLKSIQPIASMPSTGTVILLANLKILHGRGSLNPALLYEGESSRIILRNKGIR